MTRSVLLFLASLAYCSTWAHHSAIGVFDTGRTIEVSGTVESFSWRNPHGLIVLAGDDGREWHAETTFWTTTSDAKVSYPSSNPGRA